MPPKRKKDKVPKSRHHPSQSSVDVPLYIKEDVKRVQDNKCWLCNCKAHKRLRPLEICHIFPQAISKRFHFVTHHEFGYTQLHNIHDRGNLVALCSICHFALDCDEWTFIPEDTTNWTQRIEATPQIIQEYNSQRDIVFRRLLLAPDPTSKAFQDSYYKSAFTDSPTKIWPGEPGVVMVRPRFTLPPKPTAELKKTLHDFEVLKTLWLAYESPYFEEECPICQSNNEDDNGNKEDGEEDDKEDNKEDSKEDDKEDSKEDDEEDSEEDDKEDGKEDDKEDGEEDGKEDKEGESRKGISKRKPDSTGQQPPLQDFDTKKLIQANKHRKKPKNKERDWMTSAPYDESIPYSHRYGYTWAGTTSNELMKLWQVYRKPVED